MDDAEYPESAGKLGRTLAERASFVTVDDPVRPAVVDELDAVAVNGGCDLLALDVEDPDDGLDELNWMTAHNVAVHDAFLQAVLRSEAVNEALPALETTDGFGGYHCRQRDPEFEWFHSLKLDGHVAWLLVRGGAYDSFDGTHAEARDLGRAFVEELFGDRYEDVAVRRSTDQWSDWFALTPHWDETLYTYDLREDRVRLLLFSDTDWDGRNQSLRVHSVPSSASRQNVSIIALPWSVRMLSG